ncbi:MAG: HAMP domain-containing protein, partial [Kangiellaceae bacterium]|nr:HAMP domain-containing protein [Kangiellaceae bacterium]
TYTESSFSESDKPESNDSLDKKLVEFVKFHAPENNKISASLDIGDDQLISLVQPIDNDGRVYAVLQRSLNQALTPYLRLQNTLQIIFWLALFGSAVIVVFIARKVTQPVKDLTVGAKEIESGNYNARIDINLKDEVGDLATSFNSMARGLQEKERVRNLLGKVVSTEIAEELLSKDIELGGEEKQATILFSDIRSFTSICEGYSAKQILSMLNVYLTAMSEAIEVNKGVIDKYIGDAIMALFGTPVSDKQDANHAVSAAMLMSEKLHDANANISLEQVPFQMGIGINTGQVVAGNMGSPSRLNYTVIGDAVNLASRLEGLTKFYGVEVIASESTKEQASDWLFQELDWVKVKGKAKPIRIYRPICRCDKLDQKSEQLIGDSSHLLTLYRERKWDRAVETLKRLEQLDQSNFIQIYLDRIKQFQHTPPPQDWDYSFRFDTK